MIIYKRYQYCEYKQYVKNLYKKAFPQNERFPFWILKCCSTEPNVHLDCILLDNEPIGMQFAVQYDAIYYLMYFAIDEKYRNQGIGGKSLQNTLIRKDNVLLSIENPINDIQLRRKNFYLRNGFYETGCFIHDTGVDYEILSSNKGLNVTEDVLRNRYLKMTKNLVVKHIIKKSFDIDIKLSCK